MQTTTWVGSLKVLLINMEKINLILRGIKEFDFLKKDFKSNQFVDFSLENKRILSYEGFCNMLDEGKESYIVSNSMKIDFLIELKDTDTAYVDFHKEKGIICSTICFFIDSIGKKKLDTGRKKIDFLRSMTKFFSKKYKIDYFVCKLYEDDLDFYFDTFDFGKSYYNLRKNSKDIV